MSAFGWQRRLDDSLPVQEIVDVANDFLALWTPEELAQLPADCRPEQVGGASELNAYALKLAHRDTITGGISPLHRMAAFFTKAALRLFEISDDAYMARGEGRDGGGGRAEQ